MIQSKDLITNLKILVIALSDEGSKSSLVDDLQDAVSTLSFLDAGDGMEILSVILSGGVK